MNACKCVELNKTGIRNAKRNKAKYQHFITKVTIAIARIRCHEGVFLEYVCTLRFYPYPYKFSSSESGSVTVPRVERLVSFTFLCFFFIFQHDPNTAPLHCAYQLILRRGKKDEEMGENERIEEDTP